jgi:hypothetical protein
LKYVDLTIEIPFMCKVKKKYASNKRGNWNHLKVIRQIPVNIRGEYDIKELHKTAIGLLGTAHIQALSGLCNV